MKYGITEEIQSENQPKASLYPTRLGCGIHENVSFLKAAYEPLTEGSQTNGLRFYFENSEGYFNRWEWLIDDTRPDAETKLKSFYKRLDSMAKELGVDPRVAREAMRGETILELYKSIVKFFNSIVGDSPKTRIKLVLDNKDYPNFTPYTGFIETMEIPKEKSKLRIGKDERTEKVDKTGVESFGKEEGVLSSFTTTDTLPF